MSHAGHSTTAEPPSNMEAAAEFAIEGMTCSNCARHVTEAIQNVRGVANANVRLKERRATVQWTPGAPHDKQAIERAVQGAGYQAKVLDAGQEGAHAHHAATHNWFLTALTSIAPTVLLMAGEWIFGWQREPWFRWVSFALGSVVQVFAGAQFYRGAWRQLQVGSSNMDTLVALGSTTAFAYSVWALFTGAHLYFMEAAAIITLVSVGHWLEARASARAARSLQALLQLAPALARRRSSDGQENEVPVAQLQLDDVVVLKPGDRVPTDGEVLEGQSTLDESMLTGESAPVEKSPKALLYAGTVNLNGRLLMRVTATGQGTALAQIIAAVQRAQNSRARIQRLGDQVSSVFVPVVVLVAVAAALWWGLWPDLARRVTESLSAYLWAVHLPETRLAAALITAAAVLIIACPCAMGLATPVAIMAGSNAAAQRGILIRDGVALEKAGLITAVIFDKTGTLTVGKPTVVASTRFEGNRSREFEIAAALARRSNHPFSQAVAQLSSAEFDMRDWQEVRGAGVEATVKLENGEWAKVRLGSLSWLEQKGIGLALAKEFVEQWSAEGATILGLAFEGTLGGALALRDSLKAGANEVVRQLQGQGLETYLVTGDQTRTAASLARQVGIRAENVLAEVHPEQKAAFVRELQQRGQRVAFVGDGINDAPALEQADLGIAVSRASDIAREAADIILLNSEIEAVPESLGLARATLRTIKQNLFWAFFYNAVGVPLAALGFMSPVLCAAAMGLSDLVVIGNALRLRHWKSKG